MLNFLCLRASNKYLILWLESIFLRRGIFESKPCHATLSRWPTPRVVSVLICREIGQVVFAYIILLAKANYMFGILPDPTSLSGALALKNINSLPFYKKLTLERRSPFLCSRSSRSVLVRAVCGRPPLHRGVRNISRGGPPLSFASHTTTRQLAPYLIPTPT